MGDCRDTSLKYICLLGRGVLGRKVVWCPVLGKEKNSERGVSDTEGSKGGGREGGLFTSDS